MKTTIMIFPLNSPLEQYYLLVVGQSNMHYFIFVIIVGFENEKAKNEKNEGC